MSNNSDVKFGSCPATKSKSPSNNPQETSITSNKDSVDSACPVQGPAFWVTERESMDLSSSLSWYSEIEKCKRPAYEDTSGRYVEAIFYDDQQTSNEVFKDDGNQARRPMSMSDRSDYVNEYGKREKLGQEDPRADASAGEVKKRKGDLVAWKNSIFKSRNKYMKK